MEPGTQLEQGRDSSVDDHPPTCRPVDPGEHLERRRLPGPVLTEQPECSTPLDRERGVAQGPELLRLWRPAANRTLLERSAAFSVQPETLGQMLSTDSHVGHTVSPISRP